MTTCGWAVFRPVMEEAVVEDGRQVCRLTGVKQGGRLPACQPPACLPPAATYMPPYSPSLFNLPLPISPLTWRGNFERMDGIPATTSISVEGGGGTAD